MLRNSHDLLLSRANSWSEFLAELKALGNSESANKQKGREMIPHSQNALAGCCSLGL
jgi:hypothetical protein